MSSEPEDSKETAEKQDLGLLPEFKELENILYEIEKYRKEQRKIPQKIKASHSVGRVVSVYEKLRNAVSYQQEQMLRRMAIERSLNRRRFINQLPEEIAPTMIQELIHGGYLQNEMVPEIEVHFIQIIIKKYQGFQSLLEEKYQKWAVDVASKEIEQRLSPHPEDEAILWSLFKVMQRNMGLSEGSIDNSLLVSALYEIFYQADDESLRYYLMRYYFPNWTQLDPSQAKEQMSHFVNVLTEADNIINNPKRSRYITAAKKYYPFYFVLRMLAEKEPEYLTEILQDPAQFAYQVQAIMSKYQAESKLKLQRSIMKAVVFVLITKITLGIVVEIPFDLWSHGEIAYFPLAVNLTVPPLFMFLSTLLITVPGSENTRYLIKMFEELLRNPDSAMIKDLTERKHKRRNATLTGIMNFIYGVTFVSIISLLIYGLYALNFTWLSGLLFFIFLSTVSFLAFRIRTSVSEMAVIESEEKSWVLAVDFIQLPFLRVGQWISDKFKRTNVFLFFFDFVLEAPFKTIMELSEQWLGFMKEKKDELGDS